MKKIMISVGVFTLIAKLTGFGRELSLSYFFGVSDVTDAYLIAITIPTVIFNFIGMGLTSSYIPMYSSIKKKEGEEKALNFSNNFLNILLLLCTVFYILGLIFTPDLIKVFASGFEGQVLKLSIKYTRICFVGIYIAVLVSVFSGFLQVNNKFFAVALMSVPMNIVFIIGTYYASIKGEIYLPIISVLAITSQFLFLLFPTKKMGYTYKLGIKFKDENLKRIFWLSIPAIIGGSLEQINYLVDKTIASRLAIGGISILNYATKLNGAIMGIFISTIIAVLYPKISILVAEKKYGYLRNSLKKSITSICLISIPMMSGILILSYELVEIIFGRGAFNQDAVQLTARSLFYYTLGFLAIALRELITRVYYSFKDTKTPVLNSGVGILLNIVLNIVLSKYLGLSGIALATSISAIITTILLSINLERKYHLAIFEGVGFVFLKTLASSLGMAAIIFLIKHYFSDYSNYFLLIISGIVGALSYGIFISFSNIEEVNEVLRMIKKMIRKS